MLADWCDIAILTDLAQAAAFPDRYTDKQTVWPIKDAYPRPFNPELRKLVLELADKEGL